MAIFYYTYYKSILWLSYKEINFLMLELHNLKIEECKIYRIYFLRERKSKSIKTIETNIYAIYYKIN